MSLLQQREPWWRFITKAAVITAVILALFAWVESRYRIGIDGQAIRCLPDHKYYLVDMADREVQRGGIVAYRSIGLKPFFEDGTMMAKVIRGLPGDHLQVNQGGVFINGEKVAEGFALAIRIGKNEADLYRDEVIPEGKYLLLAPAPESYDGRYWGYISANQIVGKAIPFL